MTKHTQRRELDFERLKHTHPSTPTHRQFLWGFPISVKCFWISSNLKRVIILVDIADLIVQMSPTDTFFHQTMVLATGGYYLTLGIPA